MEEIKQADATEELKKAIEEYINYYNCDRIKEKLGGLTPVEYRLKALKNK